MCSARCKPDDPYILPGTTSRTDMSKKWIKATGAVPGAGVLYGAFGIDAGITAVNMLPDKSIAEVKKKLKRTRGNYMGNYVKKKKDMVFQSVDSLQQVVNVVNEASAAVSDSKRTIRESAIPEVLVGVLGAGIGGAGSFAALYGLGVVGLSAAGITSGLATAGAIIGGGMVAGVFVLAAPIAILAAGGVGIITHIKNKQLRQEKERLYKEVLARHEAIIRALKEESNASRERMDYLQGLNILLQRAVMDLSHDLGVY